jgi:hypothetical protein
VPNYIYIDDLGVTSEPNGAAVTIMEGSGASTVDPVRMASHMPATIPSSQEFYWTYAWQEAERKATADLRSGRYRDFDDPRDAVRYLLGVAR